jgi:hypothetical protein
MNGTDNAVNEGPVARRLAQVAVAGRERVIARAIERYQAPPGRRSGRRWLLPAVAVAVLGGLVVASPIAQAVGIPALSSMLASAGIGPRAATHLEGPPAHGQQPVRVTSGGHTVALRGVYGDAIHTVVLLQLEGQARVGEATLTDESGGAVPGGGTFGPGVLDFAPLGLGQHRLTLRMTSIWIEPAAGQHEPRMVPGDWTFTFPLTVSPDRVEVSPREGQLAGVRVTMNGATGDGYVVALSFETAGATLDELSGTGPELSPRPGEPRPSEVLKDKLGIQILDASGRPLQNVSGSGGPQGPGKVVTAPTDNTWNTYWIGRGPGTYRVVLTYKGERMECSFTIR